MRGKRQRTTMRRTSSVAAMNGSGSVNGDSSPMPEHPKEKLKSANCASPSACAPRQVIGFHPKVLHGAELEQAPPMSPRVSPQPSKSPGGSPRSGLGDLLAGRPPWGRKDEAVVGLGIVTALSGSQEEVGKIREDARAYAFVPTPGPAGYGRKTSPQAHLHSPSVFAPSRANPPIPIQPSPVTMGHPAQPNSGLFELPPSMRPELLFVENDSLRGGSRPNSSHTTATVNGGITSLLGWAPQADMDVEPLSVGTSAGYPRHQHHHIQSPNRNHHFLDACHLCRRRLGEGRDIYILRGDKAFCSPECRLQQIANDETFEKCSSAMIKLNGAANSRGSTHRSRVAGTAAAA